MTFQNTDNFKTLNVSDSPTPNVSQNKNWMGSLPSLHQNNYLVNLITREKYIWNLWTEYCEYLCINIFLKYTILLAKYSLFIHEIVMDYDWQMIYQLFSTGNLLKNNYHERYDAMSSSYFSHRTSSQLCRIMYVVWPDPISRCSPL